MTESHWFVAQLAVLMAAALQSATGVGLGMIAGPALILVMGSKSAIQVAIILNLSLSIVLLPGETREIHWPSLKMMILGTVLGMPAGLLLIGMLDLVALKLFAAAAITVCAVQLIHRHRHHARTGASRPASPMALPGASVASGIMASSLAMPGPVVLWALARNAITPHQIRATLRALFVISYGLALLAHALGGMDWSTVIDASLDLGIALACGTLIGFFIKRRLSAKVLNALLLGLLLVMGLSLFTTSLIELLEHA